MTIGRVGICLDPQFGDVSETIQRARVVEDAGADTMWLSQLPNQRDCLTLLGPLAAHTDRIRLGCGIVPLYSRPPVVAAQMALTLDEASGGRIELGLGIGARHIGEWTVGVPTTPPLRGMREYLAVVKDLIVSGEVNRTGVDFSGHASYLAPRRPGLPVLVGAFGPQLVRLAAEHADGVILFMCTPTYIREVVGPAVAAGLAARAEPCPDFRVVAFVAGGLADDPERDRRLFRRTLDMHLRMPSYRALFERSGHAESAAAGRATDQLMDELFVSGSPEQLLAHLDAYRAAGVSEPVISLAATAHDELDVLARTVEVAGSFAAAAA